MSITKKDIIEQLLKVQKSKENLADFCRHVMKIEPAIHHRIICDHIDRLLDDEYDELIINTPPGAAKALALDTPIVTPTGWTTMGELRIGDRVFDENGNPCSVTWVSPVHRDRPVYEVSTDSGDSIIADRDHEWLVRLCGKPKKTLKGVDRWGNVTDSTKSREPSFKIKTSEELHRRRAKRPMITHCKALNLPDVELPIDPYLLGVWLGDGTSSTMAITSSDEDRPWLMSELSRLGYEVSKSKARCLFRVRGVRHLFTAFGLIHDPEHKTYGRKHIPDLYMRSSYTQRLHLLQGLIDSDGTVDKRKGSTSFCNTNLELALQVRELVTSLGVKAGWSESVGKLNGVEHKMVYKVEFYLGGSARLPRKWIYTRNQYRTPNHYIDVVPVGIADTVCIEVDSPSHLFLCGRSMIPTHNSTYTSIALPSYFLGKNPRGQVLGVSYSTELAEKWGRKVRNTIMESAYQKVFEIGLSQDSKSAGRWATDKGGEYYAAGAGSGILGFRADCLTGDTLVRVKGGVKRLDMIKPNDYVMSYDEYTKTPTYNRVTAIARRVSDERVRIHTTDGSVVEATHNHRFFVDGCWLQAMSIGVGSVLLQTVWEDEDGSGRGDEEVGRCEESGELLLHKVMLDTVDEHKLARVQGSIDLQQLREDFTEQSEQNLLERVPTGDNKEKGIVATYSAGTELCDMWDNVSPPQQRNEVEILFDGMQKQSSFDGDVEREQPELERREESVSLCGWKRSEVSGSEETGDDSRQVSLRGVSHDRGEDGLSPHRRECAEQCVGECSDIVPTLPLETTWGRTGKVIETTVSMVERVRGECFVYDIEVEHTHNFFANNILVHNCVIIDDPISGFEEAQSQTRLEKLQGWYETDLVTRMKPNAKLVLICQRLARNDLAGYLIDRNKANPTRRQKLLILPMEATEDLDIVGRMFGDRLWPEWFTEEMVNDAKRDEYKWRTLYQQQPPSDEGSWVAPAELQFVDMSPPILDLKIYLLTDLALSVNTGDYSVHIIVGVDSSMNIYILDAWRGRVSPEVTVDKHLSLIRTYSPAESLIDDDNAAKVYVQLLAQAARESGTPVPWKVLPMRGQNKETRAAPLRGWFKRKKMFIVRAQWNEWLKAELLAFPNALGSGVDDGVDALSLIGRRLASIATPAGDPPPPTPQKTVQQMTLNELFEDREHRTGRSKRI